MSWNYVNLFELFLCDTGSGERKIRAQTRLRKKTGSRECENKQLDPEMKIMSTILDSQARKPGLGREKYASRPARGRKPGLEMEKYAARPGNENYVNYFG